MACYVGLLGLGVWSFRVLTVELMPAVESPRLEVTASWEGASPEAMEMWVTVPLEGAARRVEGVRGVRSESRSMPRGFGATAEILLEFAPGTRMDFARLRLRERLALIAEELPPGVRGPTVEPYVPAALRDAGRPFMTWRVRGSHTPGHLATVAERVLRAELTATEGVSSVLVRGGRPRQVSVVLDPRRMAALGLTADRVESRIGELSERRAAGEVDLAGRRTALTVRTRSGDLAGIRALALARRGSGTVRLGDVARVREAFAEPTFRHRIDGEPAVTLAVFRRAGADALELSERVRARLDTLRPRLPSGIRVELADDRSREIRARLNGLRLKAAASSAVILLVLAAFLRSLGEVAVVFAAIAFSVVAGVVLLSLRGSTINTLTLAGFAWSFGLVVDNAIVVFESVRRRRVAGEGAGEAAVRGARQVALPLAAATATTAVVLVPLLLVQGELRAWYEPLARSMGGSILASLAVAFTLVPALASRLPTPVARDECAGGGPPPLYLRGHRALLGIALDHPAVVGALCLACLGGSWLSFDRHALRGVDREGIPAGDTFVAVRIELPRGAGLDRTDRLARSFERLLKGMTDVERYEARVRPGWAHLRVSFPEELEATALPAAVRERLAAHGQRFSGVEVRVYGRGPGFLGRSGAAPNYGVLVAGHDYVGVRRIARSIAGRLERTPRVREVETGVTGRRFHRERTPEYFLRPDRHALAGTGIDVRRLMSRVAIGLRGARTVRRVHVGGGERAVSVKVEGFRNLSLRDLRELRVASAGGREVRVGDVARIAERSVQARIVREDQQYRRSVTWQFLGPPELGDRVRDAVLETVDLPPGYRLRAEVGTALTAGERAQIGAAAGLSLVFVFMVTAAVFESLVAPLVVLLTVPLALVGVFPIFSWTDVPFTRTTLVGVIMIVGIAVNSAILVVHRIGQLRERLSPREAILRGTLERVRPILMTTLTSVLGLLPLVVLAPARDGAAWNAPVLALAGGLLSSAVFVLTALPVACRWLPGRSRT